MAQHDLGHRRIAIVLNRTGSKCTFQPDLYRPPWPAMLAPAGARTPPFRAPAPTFAATEHHAHDGHASLVRLQRSTPSQLVRSAKRTHLPSNACSRIQHAGAMAGGSGR